MKINIVKHIENRLRYKCIFLDLGFDNIPIFLVPIKNDFNWVGVKPMINKQDYMDWHFWRRWVFFSTIGYGLGGFLGWAAWVAVIYLPFTGSTIGGVLYQVLYQVPDFALHVVGGAIAGALIGMMQWRAIRMKFPETNKLVWMAGNIVGMMIAWGLFFAVLFQTYDQKSFVLPMLVGGIAWGVISGVTQWYSFKEWLYRPMVFVLVSILIGVSVIGIGFAWIPPIAFGYMSNSGSDIFGYILFSSFASLFTWPLAGLLGGLVSGSLLVWSLQSPKMQGEVVV